MTVRVSDVRPGDLVLLEPTLYLVLNVSPMFNPHVILWLMDPRGKVAAKTFSYATTLIVTSRIESQDDIDHGRKWGGW